MGLIKEKWFQIGFKNGFKEALQTIGGMLVPLNFVDIGEDPKYDEITNEKGFKRALQQWIRDKMNPKTNFEDYMSKFFEYLTSENYFYQE